MFSSSGVGQALRGLGVAVLLVTCSSAFAQGFDPVSGLAAEGTSKPSASGTRAQYVAACRANQLQLCWALLRCGMTNNTRIDELSPAVGAGLVAASYLRSLPEDPGQGKGTFNHYRFIGGGLACTVHGPLPSVLRPDEKVVKQILKNPCFRVQFNLSTALARYSIKNKVKVPELNFEMSLNLVYQGFLPRLPDDPGKGKYTSTHYRSCRERLGVYCIYHGYAPKP